MHMGQDRMSAAQKTGLLDASTDFDRLSEPDCLMIAVPTPLTAQREPDMRYVVSTARRSGTTCARVN